MYEEADQELSPLDGYASWASCYDEDGNPLIPLEEPALQAWWPPVRGAKVLDLGCGTGRHTLALAARGAYVFALDQSMPMLARAREKFGSIVHDVIWIQHTLPDPLPIPDQEIDLAVLGLVAEHIDALDTVLLEVARVLKPGGRCVLSALHPDRTAEGQRARFIDPVSGLRHPIRTIHRTIPEYLRLGNDAGLTLLGEVTLTISPSLAEQFPRAGRYIGKPLGWVVCWSKVDSPRKAGDPTKA